MQITLDVPGLTQVDFNLLLRRACVHNQVMLTCTAVWRDCDLQTSQMSHCILPHNKYDGQRCWIDVFCMFLLSGTSWTSPCRSSHEPVVLHYSLLQTTSSKGAHERRRVINWLGYYRDERLCMWSEESSGAEGMSCHEFLSSCVWVSVVPGSCRSRLPAGRRRWWRWWCIPGRWRARPRWTECGNPRRNRSVATAASALCPGTNRHRTCWGRTERRQRTSVLHEWTEHFHKDLKIWTHVGSSGQCL